MRTGSILGSVLFLVGAALPAQPQLVVPLTPEPAWVPPLDASDPGAMPGAQQVTEAQAEALQFRVPQLKGRRLARAVNELTRDLTWHRDLEHAAEAAQATGKPIFWIQLLGDLRGRT